MTKYAPPFPHHDPEICTGPWAIKQTIGTARERLARSKRGTCLRCRLLKIGGVRG